MVLFWKKAQIEFRFKPVSDFCYPKQWFYSASYHNDDRSKVFYFTVIGLHFYYYQKKPTMEKFIEQAESAIFKVGNNAKE